MAALDDIKEKIKGPAVALAERIQETPVFQSARDRFASLSPGGQRSLIGFITLVLIGLLLMMPVTSLMNSMESVKQFEQRRDLIHDLHRATQEMQNATGLQPPPPMAALQSRIENELKNNSILQEQIRAIQQDTPPASLPKSALTGALIVSLAKLNLRQIVDVGSLLQGLGSAIKVVDMDFQADLQDPRYYNVIYKLIALNVPSLPPPEPEPAKNKAKLPNANTKKGADE
jgi:type II secretory pathway pseudopilin PulG